MTQPRIIVGGLIILIGLSLLFDLPIFRILFPLIIIWIGFSILMGQRWQGFSDDRSTSDENYLKRVLIFSGINKKFTSKDFKGAEVVAIFGGGEVDLSAVSTRQKEVKLSIVAIFGGLKLIIPPGWSVISEGVGIVGGFDNKTKGGKETTRAKVEGVAIFGGVEVVN